MAKALEEITHEGVTLPPRNLRPCGANFQDDDFYLSSGKQEATMLADNLGLSADSALLDIGSGPGRLAIGIINTLGDIRKFRGVDVKKQYIEWAQEHVTPEHPSFRFLHVDIENSRYNPKGTRADEGFRFPFEDGEFDIITLYSVFTHMMSEDVRAYLSDFDRLLSSSGRIYLTAFLEDDVPDVEENPDGYLGRQWKGALHCVRYEEGFFRGLLAEKGFQLDGFDPNRGHGRGREKGQRGLFVSRTSG